MKVFVLAARGRFRDDHHVVASFESRAAAIVAAKNHPPIPLHEGGHWCFDVWTLTELTLGVVGGGVPEREYLDLEDE